MALIPKNFKYKKYKKGRLSKSLNKKKHIVFGHLALKAKEPARLTYKQLEAARKFIKKKIKPFGGIIKRKVNLSVKITSKPVATRMGRGKGRVDSHICLVKAGQPIYEIYCLNLYEAKKAALKSIHKLPIGIKLDVKNV